MTQKALKGSTTQEPTDGDVNVCIKGMLMLYMANSTILKLYMPLSTTHRPQYLFKLLVSVKALDKPTKAILIKHFKYHLGTLIKATNLLENEGYIRIVGKPRLIKPFQRYKIDKGYVVTPKGEQAIRKIISSLL